MLLVSWLEFVFLSAEAEGGLRVAGLETNNYLLVIMVTNSEKGKGKKNIANPDAAIKNNTRL